MRRCACPSWPEGRWTPERAPLRSRTLAGPWRCLQTEDGWGWHGQREGCGGVQGIAVSFVSGPQQLRRGAQPVEC